MKRKHLYVIVILIVSILFAAMLLELTRDKTRGQILSTIDFTETYSTISTIYQRKTFFADGYYWLFYCNGTHLLYVTSSNGSDWSAPTAMMRLTSASALSLWYDGKIHYALAPGSEGSPLSTKKGVLWPTTFHGAINRLLFKA